MKPSILIVFLCVFAWGQAQDTTTTTGEKPKIAIYEPKEPSIYKMRDQDFTFTPEVNGISIKKMQNKEEIDFGRLRRTTDDGLYIMTTTLSDEVSFGRFDSLGNFRTLRYDSKNDSVLEDIFEIRNSNTLKSPKK